MRLIADFEQDVIWKIKSFAFVPLFSYAQSVGATHYETSAKNNIGVEDLFFSLTNMVRLMVHKQQATHSEIGNTHLRLCIQQMINMSDQKRSQENTLNRTNSTRRVNTITVAPSEDEDETNTASTTTRCCGTS